MKLKKSKKSIKDFILSEDAKISKKALIIWWLWISIWMLWWNNSYWYDSSWHADGARHSSAPCGWSHSSSTWTSNHSSAVSHASHSSY